LQQLITARVGELGNKTLGADFRSEARLDRLLKRKTTNTEGRHLETPSSSMPATRCSSLPYASRPISKRPLRPSVISLKITNGFRSDWGVKILADLCSIVATDHVNAGSIRAALTIRSEPATS
jgi:hypothetical protein